MATASCTGKILSCDSQFQHWPFDNGSFNSVTTFLDTGQTSQLPLGAGETTIGEQSSRAIVEISKTVKCNY